MEKTFRFLAWASLWLAELQADIQIYTTATFGTMSAFLAFVVTFKQLQFTVSSTTYRIVFGLLALFASVCLIASATHWLNKAILARKQMKDLRNRYVF